MIALTHDNARDWLNVGSAELNAAEREALATHLDHCSECQVYATELSELHTALTRLFRTRWQSMPSQQAMDAAITRLKQRQTRQRATRRINTLAFAAGLAVLALALVWVLNRPAVPAGPQTAAAPAAPSTGPAPEATPTPIPGLATFDKNIMLVDAVMEKTRWMAGSTISLTLRWRAPSAMKTSYTSFVHLLDSAGNVVAQSDSIPGVARPTTGQPPDEIGETLYLALPDDLAGRYEVVTGLYDAATGARLQTGEGQTYAALGTIEVQPIPHRIHEDFGNFATLLGADGLPDSISAGEAISLTLYWRPLATTTASYLISLQVFGENKRLVAQVDGVPGNGMQPTTSWQPGEIIGDSYTLNLPADLPPGQYRLLLLMFDSASGAQVFTGSGNGTVMLDTLQIAPASGTPFPTPTPWVTGAPLPASTSRVTRPPLPTSTPWITRTPVPAATPTP